MYKERKIERREKGGKGEDGDLKFEEKEREKVKKMIGKQIVEDQVLKIEMEGQEIEKKKRKIKKLEEWGDYR